jgi:hypothetical protein
MRRLACLLTLGGFCLAVPVGGQEAPPGVPAPEAHASEAPETDPQAPALDPPLILDPTAPAKTEITLDWRTQVGAGVGFSGPLGAVGSFRLLHGLGADVRDDSTRVKAVCAVPIPHCAQGFLLQADAGSGGGKLSLGLGARARVDDDDFHGTAGVALRLALARTWGNPLGTEPGLTYLGPELDLSVLRINVTLGVLWRVSGEGGASALFSWGLGFGM